jgi:hypothetical protein
VSCVPKGTVISIAGPMSRKIGLNPLMKWLVNKEGYGILAIGLEK